MTHRTTFQNKLAPDEISDDKFEPLMLPASFNSTIQSLALDPSKSASSMKDFQFSFSKSSSRKSVVVSQDLSISEGADEVNPLEVKPRRKNSFTSGIRTGLNLLRRKSLASPPTVHDNTLKLNTSVPVVKENEESPISPGDDLIGYIPEMTMQRRPSTQSFESSASKRSSRFNPRTCIDIILRNKKPIINTDIYSTKSRDRNTHSFTLDQDWFMDSMASHESLGLISGRGFSMIDTGSVTSSISDLARMEPQISKMAQLVTDEEYASTAFAKKYAKDRIYLSTIIFNEKKEIITYNNLIPSIQLYGDDEDSGNLFDNIGVNSETFQWVQSTCLDWEPQVSDISDESNVFSFTLNSLYTRYQGQNPSISQTRAMTKLKKRYLLACARFQDSFRLKNFGTLHRTPAVMRSDGCINIVQIIYAKVDTISTDLLKSAGCTWKSASKLDSSVYDKENKNLWTDFYKIYTRSLRALNKGLYVALFNCVVTVKGPMIMVQKQYPNLPPLVRVREKASLDSLESILLSSALEDESHDYIRHSGITGDIINTFENFRSANNNQFTIKNLVSAVPSELDNNVHFLVISSITPLGLDIPPYDTALYELIPILYFESIHFSMYTAESYRHHYRQLRLANRVVSGIPVGFSLPCTGVLTFQEQNIIFNLNITTPTSANIGGNILSNATQIETFEASTHMKQSYNETKWTRKALATMHSSKSTTKVPKERPISGRGFEAL